MSDDPLRSALERVERHGDVSAGHDPSSAALRARIQREHLATWDHEMGRLVLTSGGRQRLMGRTSGRHDAARGTVAPFRRKPGTDEGA